MFTMEEIVSNRNQRDAMASILSKKNGHGVDGMQIKDFQEYWSLNKKEIVELLINGKYEPGAVMTYEIVNAKGKVREVSSLNIIDRFVARMFSQKMRRYVEPLFLENSFAYQEGKGIQEAVKKAQDYINAGDKYVCEIDIENFFDSINHNKLLMELETYLRDERLRNLATQYIKCKVEHDDTFYITSIGLIQGNPLSPILSNIYLHKLDCFMEEKGYHWVRFADDINIYAVDELEAEQIYEQVVNYIKTECFLSINDKKSCVRPIIGSSYLGYDFYKYAGCIFRPLRALCTVI